MAIAQESGTGDGETHSPDTIHAMVGKRIRMARLARRMSLTQLGGDELSRSFLSVVENGRSRISLRALAIVARRLQLPISYFVEDVGPDVQIDCPEATVDHVEAALAYSQLLRSQGRLDQALDYALWAARARLMPSKPHGHQSWR